METIFDSGLIWWITAVDIPVLSGLFWMMLKVKHESEEAVEFLRESLELRTSQLRETLSAFKLEVAKSYASVADMKDLERRIVSHLLRIESKLDRTALITAELKAQQQE